MWVNITALLLFISFKGKWHLKMSYSGDISLQVKRVNKIRKKEWEDEMMQF